MTEAEFKRDLVRQLNKEGGYARRLEDRYAVGTLDLLLLTERFLIYAEAKLIKGLALPARVAQREQIQLFNKVGNVRAYALIIGLKDKTVGFGLPGERWDMHYTTPWPTGRSLTHHLDHAVEAIFDEELV